MESRNAMTGAAGGEAADGHAAGRVTGKATAGGLEDFALLLASRGVSLAAGVAFVAVSARLFPPSAIALLAWIAIFSGAAETLRGFGITNVLTRRLPALAADPDEAARWVATHFRYASLPLIVAPLLVAPLMPFLWTAAAFGAALQLVVNNHIYVYQAIGRFRIVSLATILSTLLQRAAPLAAAWHWSLAVNDFILLQALLGLPACATLTYGLRHQIWSPRLVPWRECWPQARAFYAAGLVRYGATQADQWLVALLFPAQALAPYFLIRRLYSAVVVVISAGVDVLIPRLGRRALDGPEAVRGEQARVLKRATCLCAVLGCLVAANAGAIVPLVVGETYEAPPFVVPALMVAALGYGLFSFALAGEVIAGPARETFRIAAAAALAPLVIVPILIPLLSVAALPAAMAAGYVAASGRSMWGHSRLRAPVGFALGGIALVGFTGAAQELLRRNGAGTLAETILLNLFAGGLAAGVAYSFRARSIGG